MAIDYSEIELQNWFSIKHLQQIVSYMVHFNTDFNVTVFRNGGGTYSFYVSNGYYGDNIKSTDEFQHVCKTQNVGIIKEVILTLKQYLRQNGFDGELKIGQLL